MTILHFTQSLFTCRRYRWPHLKSHVGGWWVYLVGKKSRSSNNGPERYSRVKGSPRSLSLKLNFCFLFRWRRKSDNRCLNLKITFIGVFGSIGYFTVKDTKSVQWTQILNPKWLVLYILSPMSYIEYILSPTSGIEVVILSVTWLLRIRLIPSRIGVPLRRQSPFRPKKTSVITCFHRRRTRDSWGKIPSSQRTSLGTSHLYFPKISNSHSLWSTNPRL